jgi:hypothetical protein
VSSEYVPLILQTVVLLIAIVASIRHSEKRITRIETKVESLEDAVKPIPGMSRAVARVEGEISAHRKAAGH